MRIADPDTVDVDGKYNRVQKQLVSTADKDGRVTQKTRLSGTMGKVYQ